MKFPLRRFRSPWLLLLVLACSLLGRPLHEAWHVAHPFGETAGIAAAGRVVVSPAVDGAATAPATATATAADDPVPGQEDSPGAKSDSCAWCLFHAQAAAPGGTPQALLTHAEASPPPAALPCGRVCSRDWTVAKPRGPPAA